MTDLAFYKNKLLSIERQIDGLKSAKEYYEKKFRPNKKSKWHWFKDCICQGCGKKLTNWTEYHTLEMCNKYKKSGEY